MMLAKLLKIISLFFVIPVFLRVIVNSIKSSSLILVMSAVYLLLYCVICKDKNLKTKFRISLCIMVILQLLSGWLLMVEYCSWDVFAVTKNARALVNDAYFNREYFARYPNNIAIMLFFTGVFKFTNLVFGSTSNYFLVLLNIVAIDLAVVFTVKSIELIYDEKIACKTGIVLSWFAPLYLYVPICYTDTFSMPILMGIIYYFLYILKNQNEHIGNKRLFAFFILGAVILIGFKLKGSIIISLVAILIVCFIKYDYKNFIKITLSLFGGLILTSALWSTYIDSTNLISAEEYEKYKFPATHWIMMGLNGRGSYNSECVNFTKSFDTYDERLNATVEQIKNKIIEIGPKGVVDQVYKKAIKYGWNYGTCFAQRYLGDDTDKPLHKNILHEFILSDGAYNHIYNTVTQSLWVVLLFFAMIAYLLSLKDNNMEKMFLRLVLVGGMVFFMIWETHPRYILNFSLILIMIAVPEIDKTISQLLNKQ